MAETLLRLHEVIAQVKLSRSTIYRRIDEGTFPRPRSLGSSCVRWLQSEIDQWIDALPVADDLDQQASHPDFRAPRSAEPGR